VVSQGAVPIGHTASYYYIGKSPATAFGTTVPFGLNAQQQNAWLYDGGGLPMLQDLYRDKFNVIQFPAGNTGVQMGGWFRKEINTVEDLQGLTMRIPGLGGQVMAKLGVTVQVLAGGEIFQALQTGAVDAAEFVGPYDDEKLGLNKVAPNYAYPGFWEGGAQLEFWINSAAYNGLSAENKAIVEAAAFQAATVMTARYDARNPAALKKLVAQGTKLFRFPKDVMDAAFKASQEVYAEIGSKNASFKKIHDDYMAFRRDANLWFRFSEATFDDFMQQQRL
jgi:TRAP-type mannitol/chloroaromatic compound transport system substrate-binding protein